MMKNIFLFVLLSIFYTAVFSQHITYSQPESGDSKSMDFQIIGKLKENLLIYKNNRNDYAICSYDNEMRLIGRTNLTMMPDKVLNVDFVVYPDFAYLIYQYQKKNLVYCMAFKLNSEGKLMTDPIALDTTHINFLADNKIYNTTYSENKSKIMIYKIQKKNGRFHFTTLLFNDSLELLHKSDIQTNFDDKQDRFSDFYIDDHGSFVFTRGNKSSSRDYMNSLALVIKAPDADTFSVNGVKLLGNYLDAIKLKVDNVNNDYVVNSFYYTKPRGNIEGLYTAVWDKDKNQMITQQFLQLGDSIRNLAKSDKNLKTALDDFFLTGIVLKKDGGFVITAESHYSDSRSDPWNRYDYQYGNPAFSPYNSYLYSPYSYGYGGYSGGYPYYNNSNSYNQRYYYNNVLVLNLNKSGTPDWVSVVNKSQYDDQGDSYLSYASVLTGGKLHFLFNTVERRTEIVNDQSVDKTGKVTRNPPLRNLDRGYQFMLRYGKQVSATQIIVPCIFRNYICFAKIEYE
jgi:hypothetical protein